MDLSTYIADSDRRRQLVADTGKSAGYLWQVATGWRGKRASAELAILIESKTAGLVHRGSLRRDLFGAPPEVETQPAVSGEAA